LASDQLSQHGVGGDESAHEDESSILEQHSQLSDYCQERVTDPRAAGV
jgi:hypothetical protein